VKRSNRPVLVLGPQLAVVAFGGTLAAGAPNGGAADAPAQWVALVTAAIDPALGAPVADLMEADGSSSVILNHPAHGTAVGVGASTVSFDTRDGTISVTTLVQNVQVLATAVPRAPTPDGVTNPDTGQPILRDRPVTLGVTPQQAELVRFAQLDGNLSLLLRSPQDAATADVTTAGVTLRQPGRRARRPAPAGRPDPIPLNLSWDRARLTGARA